MVACAIWYGAGYPKHLTDSSDVLLGFWLEVCLILYRGLYIDRRKPGNLVYGKRSMLVGSSKLGCDISSGSAFSSFRLSLGVFDILQKDDRDVE